MYFFADFELHTTYRIDWSLLRLYAALLLPNGIKLFETDSLLNIGYIGYNIEYPKKLHELHNDYPCGPEKIKVTRDMVSPYCQKIADIFKVSTGLVHKLIPTLENKEKYVLHDKTLQL